MAMAELHMLQHSHRHCLQDKGYSSGEDTQYHAPAAPAASSQGTLSSRLGAPAAPSPAPQQLALAGGAPPPGAAPALRPCLSAFQPAPQACISLGLPNIWRASAAYRFLVLLSTAYSAAAAARAGEAARMVDAFCTPGGLRAQPSQDDCRVFVESLGHLDGDAIVAELEAKMVGLLLLLLLLGNLHDVVCTLRASADMQQGARPEQSVQCTQLSCAYPLLMCAGGRFVASCPAGHLCAGGHHPVRAY